MELWVPHVALLCTSRKSPHFFSIFVWNWILLSLSPGRALPNCIALLFRFPWVRYLVEMNAPQLWWPKRFNYPFWYQKWNHITLYQSVRSWGRIPPYLQASFRPIEKSSLDTKNEMIEWEFSSMFQEWDYRIPWQTITRPRHGPDTAPTRPWHGLF